mmetsp:Transcript_64537/g.154165  ORF Transcript_64537/g.154165 Transcript_64537/m.154165 type:complete len:279 (-) Transcript_64537:660-1496(-)
MVVSALSVAFRRTHLGHRGRHWHFRLALARRGHLGLETLTWLFPRCKQMMLLTGPKLKRRSRSSLCKRSLTLRMKACHWSFHKSLWLCGRMANFSTRPYHLCSSFWPLTRSCRHHSQPMQWSILALKRRLLQLLQKSKLPGWSLCCRNCWWMATSRRRMGSKRQTPGCLRRCQNSLWPQRRGASSAGRHSALALCWASIKTLRWMTAQQVYSRSSTVLVLPKQQHSCCQRLTPVSTWVPLSTFLNFRIQYMDLHLHRRLCLVSLKEPNPALQECSLRS